MRLIDSVDSFVTGDAGVGKFGFVGDEPEKVCVNATSGQNIKRKKVTKKKESRNMMVQLLRKKGCK